MPRIPHLYLGLLTGTAIAQYVSGQTKAAAFCLILLAGALLSNHWLTSGNAKPGPKKHMPRRNVPLSPPAPLLKIFTICTAGSCSLAIAASSHLYLTTSATVFIALTLTLSTTIISLVLFHLNTQ
ncbi:MAG: hypothetical protein DI628_03050 [Blastochloris viridis]|uniref:Uncharacterized protein n=1 Tax=Blastochloris viridis TaxID=1079 RepID=A0A6N4REW1_BLAVI|nr:MAG: hypothetical protein DI628_03050 [Blastochloris viridis]